MAKVKNTKRAPIDIEIDNLVEEVDGGENQVTVRDNLNLGPREESRELSADEMKSAQIQANIAAGNLVVIEDEPAAAETAEPEAAGATVAAEPEAGQDAAAGSSSEPPKQPRRMTGRAVENHDA